MNNEKRISYIDLSKGFCICLVVFNHIKAVLDCNYILDSFFSSFRIPLYFFLSGLFFKDYGNIKNFIIKKTNRLLIPFFFFYTCFSVLLPNILYYFFGKEYESIVTGWPSLWAFIYPGYYANFPVWFLWCLFLVNIMFWLLHALIERYCLHKNSVLLAVCLVLGLMGYYLSQHDVVEYGRNITTLVYTPFFCIGYLLKKFNGLQRLQALFPNQALLYAVVMVSVTLLFTLVIPINSVIIFYLCGLTGIFFILLLSRSIVRLPFFSYVGRYSIIVLVTHGMIMWVCSPFYSLLSRWTDNDDFVILIMTVFTLSSYYLVIPVMCRFFPHVTAQKPLLNEKYDMVKKSYSNN